MDGVRGSAKQQGPVLVGLGMLNWCPWERSASWVGWGPGSSDPTTSPSKEVALLKGTKLHEIHVIHGEKKKYGDTKGKRKKKKKKMNDLCLLSVWKDTDSTFLENSTSFLTSFPRAFTHQHRARGFVSYQI